MPGAKAKIDEGIISEVRRRTRSSMRDAGFKSRGGMFFAPTADPEVSRRVAFGHISYDADGICKVQPFVGVRWESLERLLTEWSLQADEVDPRTSVTHDGRATSVTLNINPGYLGPEETFRVFPMPSLGAVPSLVSAMVGEVLMRGPGCGISSAPRRPSSKRSKASFTASLRWTQAVAFPSRITCSAAMRTPSLCCRS